MPKGDCSQSSQTRGDEEPPLRSSMSSEDDGQRGRFSFLGTADLENLRDSCSYRYAPSQAMMPPQPE